MGVEEEDMDILATFVGEEQAAEPVTKVALLKLILSQLS